MNSTLPTRLKDFRLKLGYSQDDLARALSVTRASILRWEAGSSKPSRLAANALEKIGFGEIKESDTNIDSLSRIDHVPHEKLMDGITSELKINGKKYKVKPSSYVINGPENQISFHNELIALQERSVSKEYEKIYLKNLSIIKDVDGVTTSQYELETPKSTARSWNSNYGTHGWHRYVGRFPPHLVRTLINNFGLEPGDIVLDPFVGSGTTMVEARMLGLKGIGIDVCPLSSLISRAKSMFPEDVLGLINVVDDYQKFYDKKYSKFTAKNPNYSAEMVLERDGNPIPEFSNYQKWFTSEALLGSSITAEFVNTLEDYERDFVSCHLSSLMRSIGNVEVNVVRAEYSKKPRENVDVKSMLTRQCLRAIKDIRDSIATHPALSKDPLSIQILGDGIQNAKIAKNSIDAIITSPPYGVEAISYLRTHLLSYRSLASVLGHDPYENNKNIIGSEYLRKDTKVEHLAAQYSNTYSTFFKKYNSEEVPKKLQSRIDMMMKFFDDMAITAKLFKHWLKPGGKVAFVVGNKKLGDYVIPTHEIISEIFNGFGIVETKVIKHKLKTNNSNSQVPWQSRIIQDEYVIFMESK